ncbi:uncharacterized protein LOC119719626 [Patiria miniata]|uniref:Protein kinase domain-containing protein n=1 Tax=Patiria miniata TaxID=46514 RepID=A0A913Z2X4_PATMI|nr:uncharacterized protein LOC119719626 [Patiria miniata]
MAADLGNCDGHKKTSQSKQNDGEKSQTSTVGNRSSDGRARGRPFSCPKEIAREGRLGGGPSGSPRGLALAVPPTLQNGQAVRRMLEDQSVQEHHNVNVSMPGRDAWNTQGIRHGKAGDVIIFANRIERLKTRNPAELRGYHQGVLLHKYLTPSHSTPSQYREGEQYIVIKRLGKGGSGVAFLLKDEYSGIQFVRKRVSVKYFEASEAVLWCPLDHRGIVGFLGLLLTDDWVMFLSSYQEGSETLQELIDRHVLDLGLALEIIQQLLVVVNWLHSDHHIVHFDIKRKYFVCH